MKVNDLARYCIQNGISLNSEIQVYDNELGYKSPVTITHETQVVDDSAESTKKTIVKVDFD